MSWKFTLLGLERDNSNCNDVLDKGIKSTNQQKKFTKAVQTCHKQTRTKEAFGKCMKKQLKN